jgi:hypothetical protein
MLFPEFLNSPFQVKLSFHKLIERYKQLASFEKGSAAAVAMAKLKLITLYPDLAEIIDGEEKLTSMSKTISQFLSDIFPIALTNEEIKAVTIPYQNKIFNPTAKFSRIIASSGSSFEISLSGDSRDCFYVALIFTYQTPLTIRFRTDEQYFVVEGAYNLRYQVIKKRIDKARIFGFRGKNSTAW